MQCAGMGCKEGFKDVATFDQILSTFKFSTSLNSTITAEKAIEIVSALPEVKTFFVNTPNAKISLDPTQSSTDKFWAVQVYESFPDHNATFHWYNVDKTTGETTKQV
jgi:hypothetical protein